MEKSEPKESFSFLPFGSSSKLSFWSRWKKCIKEIREEQKQGHKLFVQLRLELLFDEESVKIVVPNTFKRLTNLAKTIFYVATTESCHFDESILSRFNKDDFCDQLWPRFATVGFQLLDNVSESNSFSKLYVIDNESRDESCIQAVISYVEKGYYLKRRLFANNVDEIRWKLQANAFKRDNRYVVDLVKQNKWKFFDFMKDFERNLFQLYESSKSSSSAKISFVQDVVREFERRIVYNEEQRSVFKNIFTSGSQKNVRSISSILIEETTALCRLLSPTSVQISIDNFAETAQASSLNSLILSVGEILINLSKHFIFRHHIFNDPGYPLLINEMLKTDDYLIKMVATRLVTVMLNSDHKRYGAKLVDQEGDLVQLLYSTIVSLYSLFRSPLKNIRHFEVLGFVIENISYRSLELIFKGSLDNCAKLSVEQVCAMVDLVISIDKPVIKCSIYGILNSLLKYGPTELWTDQVDGLALIDDIAKTIGHLSRRDSFRVLWEKAATFMKDLLTFLQKGAGSLEIGEAEETEEVELDTPVRISHALSMLGIKNVEEVLDLISPSSFQKYDDPETFADLIIRAGLKHPKMISSYSILCSRMQEILKSEGQFDLAAILFKVWNKEFVLLLNDWKASYPNHERVSEPRAIKLKRNILSLVNFFSNLSLQPLFEEEFVIENFLKKAFEFVSFSDSLALEILYVWIKTNEKKSDRHLKAFEEGLETLNKVQMNQESTAWLNKLIKFKQNGWKDHEYSTDFCSNLVASLYASIVRNEDATLDLKDEKSEKVSAEILKMENSELKSEKKALTSKIRELEAKVEKLRLDLEDTERDKMVKDNEISSLREAGQSMKRQMEAIARESSFQSSSSDSKLAPIATVTGSAPIQVQRHDEDEELVKRKIGSLDEAKRFVDVLRTKRENLKDFRKLICGDLEHLSLNLYTSPHHFLSELIQNFEDNEYDRSRRPWFAKLIIDAHFLLFCNNELGFQAKHVLSICSNSESSKEKGKHIGNKGLGFKSVFLCSDSPTVVSRPFWRFQFKKTPQNDAIAYLTPLFLDPLPEPLAEAVESNSESNTFIFLPLKEVYKFRKEDDESVAYFDKILSNIDPKVLLFTRKLEKFVVEDRVHKTTTIIECLKSSQSNLESLSQHYSAIDCVLRSQIDGVVGIDSLFRLFTHTIEVPEDLRRNERLECVSTEISLAFPLDMTNEPCAVHNCLPIIDQGFPFLINCNFILVTSRESVNEHSRFNLYLRERLAALFVQVASREPGLQSRIVNYLPREGSRMSDWWRAFVRDVRQGLKPFLKDILQTNVDQEEEGTTPLKTLLWNESLAGLMNEALLEAARIKVLQPDPNMDYEYFGFHKISINDLVDAFCSNRFDFDPAWWEQFFRMVLFKFYVY